MINQKRLVALTQELIRIDSQNPPGNEEALGNFVRAKLKKLGLSVQVVSFAPHRPNIIATRKGRNPKYSLLMSPHLDTVPAGSGWKFDPLGGRIHNGKIYGRGATDCKCNLAIAIEAIESLVEDKVVLDYDIIFAATADEECGSELGIIPLLDKKIIKPDCALILDSDDFKIIIAQKGLIHSKVFVKGKKAHGAYPWRGENAIEAAARIICDLKAYKFHYTAHALLRPPTINIGTIKGGDKVNMVADSCEFEIDIRFLPGMSHERIMQDVKRIISRHAKKFRIQSSGIQAPYEIQKTHSLVKHLASANQKVVKAKHFAASEGATVITFFQRHAIPAVAYGCGSGGCAHATNEYVLIRNLCRGAAVVEEFLKQGNGSTYR